MKEDTARSQDVEPTGEDGEELEDTVTEEEQEPTTPPPALPDHRKYPRRARVQLQWPDLGIVKDILIDVPAHNPFLDEAIAQEVQATRQPGDDYALSYVNEWDDVKHFDAGTQRIMWPPIKGSHIIVMVTELAWPPAAVCAKHGDSGSPLNPSRMRDYMATMSTNPNMPNIGFYVHLAISVIMSTLITVGVVTGYTSGLGDRTYRDGRLRDPAITLALIAALLIVHLVAWCNQWTHGWMLSGQFNNLLNWKSSLERCVEHRIFTPLSIRQIYHSIANIRRTDGELCYDLGGQGPSSASSWRRWEGTHLVARYADVLKARKSANQARNGARRRRARCRCNRCRYEGFGKDEATGDKSGGEDTQSKQCDSAAPMMAPAMEAPAVTVAQPTPKHCACCK